MSIRHGCEERAHSEGVRAQTPNQQEYGRMGIRAAQTSEPFCQSEVQNVEVREITFER